MTQSVKGIELEFASTPIGAITRIERDMVRKVVQQPKSWAYLRMEWIKVFCEINISSFSLTTTMVKSNIQYKSSATNARSPGYSY